MRNKRPAKCGTAAFVTTVIEIKLMKSIVLTICLILPASSIWAREAGEVLERMRQNMDGLESYRVTLKTEALVRGAKEVREAETETILMVKDRKQYRETTGTDAAGQPIDRIQIFDGTINWDYDRIRNVARKADLNKVTKEIREELQGQNDLTQLGPLADFEFELGTGMIGEKEYYTLQSQELITMGAQTFDRVKLWIDKKSYLPARMLMASTMEFGYPGGEKVRMEQEIIQNFKDWEPNIEIDEKVFKSPIPVVVKVVDETKKMEQMYRVYRSKQKEWRKKREME